MVMRGKVKSEKLKGKTEMRNPKPSNPGLRFSVPGLCFVHIFAFCLLTLGFYTGCEESFEPLQENEAFPFSIYGYLDASADTQWVRVSPARKTFEPPAEKPDMHVTLEHLESGHYMSMNDSLIQLRQGFIALNVWTDMAINPGGSYRLKAERPDGAASSVTVTLPEQVPVVRFIETGLGSGVVMISGVEHLADVQSRWHLLIAGRQHMISIPLRMQAERLAEGEYRLFIDRNREQRQISDQLLLDNDIDNDIIQILKREVFVASAGPEWVEDMDSMDDLIFALPEGLSNVDHGVGYMIGVISKTLEL